MCAEEKCFRLCSDSLFLSLQGEKCNFSHDTVPLTKSKVCLSKWYIFQYGTWSRYDFVFKCNKYKGMISTCAFETHPVSSVIIPLGLRKTYFLLCLSFNISFIKCLLDATNVPYSLLARLSHIMYFPCNVSHLSWFRSGLIYPVPFIFVLHWFSKALPCFW